MATPALLLEKLADPRPVITRLLWSFAATDTTTVVPGGLVNSLLEDGLTSRLVKTGGGGGGGVEGPEAPSPHWAPAPRPNTTTARPLRAVRMTQLLWVSLIFS